MRIRQILFRVLVAVLSILSFAGSALAWVFEVSPKWEFNHSMRFAITSLFLGIFLAFLAIRGNIFKKKDP